jgi:protein TonB
MPVAPPPPAAIRRQVATAALPRPAAAPLSAPSAITPETAPAVAEMPPPGALDLPVGSALGIPDGVVGSRVEREPEPVPAPVARVPVRVGGTVRAPTRLSAAAPVYPPMAISARVEGEVMLEALIDEQGRVGSVRVLRSVPLLDTAAVDAVRTWRYTPTLLNGVPVSVLMTVTVNFRLQH